MASMILDRVPAAPAHRLRNVYILPQPARRKEFEERYRTTVLWQGWGMTEIFPHVPARDRLDNVPDDTIGVPPSWVDFGVVDEDDRGRLDRADGLEREQLRVAGACAHEGDGTGGGHGNPLRVFHACEANCTMCATCASTEAGTGLRPASTSWI